MCEGFYKGKQKTCKETKQSFIPSPSGEKINVVRLGHIKETKFPVKKPVGLDLGTRADQRVINLKNISM